VLRAALLTALLLTSPAHAGLEDADVKVLSFQDLDGWAEDNHRAALDVFLHTCTMLDEPQWAPLCALGKDQPDARAFFELFFRPVLIEDGKSPLFTAYYEPVINGALHRSATYRWPVYAKPDDLPRSGRYFTRAQIERDGALLGRGLEIAWVDDPVKLQFLQIQGSGRIRLTDGSHIRLGYAGSNGHTYRSLGKELVRRGIYDAHQVSAAVIGNWVRRNPIDGASLLLHNASYVFFRKLEHLPPGSGPVGAMNRAITAHRSIAVDPAFTPLGAPVWLEKHGAQPFSRLMIAQDTGSRIKGAQRADIFWGTGVDAGKQAGRIRDNGRMIVLLPIQRAFFLASEE
jgi:membrane-bound lytic murein transglycosylase A